MGDKYNIDFIKEMRLKGKTLKEISEHYNVEKSTISRFLKRRDIEFWKLSKKCNYCGEIFIPKKPKYKYCCLQHYKYNKYEKDSHSFKKKRKKIISLDRTNPNIAYKESLNNLNELRYYAEKKGCSWCSEHDFGIADGEIYCKKCGLVFEL